MGVDGIRPTNVKFVRRLNPAHRRAAMAIEGHPVIRDFRNFQTNPFFLPSKCEGTHKDTFTCQDGIVSFDIGKFAPNGKLNIPALSEELDGFITRNPGYSARLDTIPVIYISQSHDQLFGALYDAHGSRLFSDDATLIQIDSHYDFDTIRCNVDPLNNRVLNIMNYNPVTAALYTKIASRGYWVLPEFLKLSERKHISTGYSYGLGKALSEIYPTICPAGDRYGEDEKGNYLYEYHFNPNWGASGWSFTSEKYGISPVKTPQNEHGVTYRSCFADEIPDIGPKSDMLVWIDLDWFGAKSYRWVGEQDETPSISVYKNYMPILNNILFDIGRMEKIKFIGITTEPAFCSGDYHSNLQNLLRGLLPTSL